MTKALIAPIALALMLCAGSPSPLAVVPVQKVTISLGTLIKVVHTRDGDLKIWRDPTGCTVVFRDLIIDRVDLDICRA